MPDIKSRKIVANILNFIDDKEIIVIHGSRQVGKTSLLHYLMDNFVKKKIPANNIFYFDLEDFLFLELCNTSPDEVMLYAKSKGADITKKIYFFIDEIQYLNNPSSFLKLFHDRYKEVAKLIVSGSSSMLIKKKFRDSLVGRIIDFELFTLDFEEFLEFKGIKYNLKEPLPDIVHKELKKLYEEFVIFGGYPAIVLEDVISKKEIKLKQIINTYLTKDIRDIANIKHIDKFNSLVKLLATQAGNLVNILELSLTLGLAKATVEEYLFLLENTYIIKRIRPFHKNVRSELTKMPKIYFEDTGMLNILVNKTFTSRVEGQLLENSIYSQLRKNLPVECIYFWRTNTKQEVDFIIEYIDRHKNEALRAIEVKNTFFNKNTTNLRYFKNKYQNAKIFFCCLEKKEDKKDKDVKVINPWELLNMIDIHLK